MKSSLFNESEALHDFFFGINRAHFEFALSPNLAEIVDIPIKKLLTL